MSTVSPLGQRQGMSKSSWAKVGNELVLQGYEGEEVIL